MKYIVLVLALVAGCIDETDPVWQLDHDRIVAVRASKPHIAPGESATIDALVAHKGAPTDIETPLAVLVYALHDFDSAVDGNRVNCPDAAALDAERATLGLDPGTPIPLDVVMQFPDSNGIHLLAKKTIYLGDSADNPPTVGNVTIADAPPDPSIVVPIDVDVHMSVDADPTSSVAWLTSCGTMHDDDEHAAFLHVLKDDPKDGELVLVVRDASGGVVWQTWPISAQ
jgi:hypothetical protein